MYGIVYKALKQFVIETHNEHLWDFISADSPVTFNAELMEQPYNDDATHYLASRMAACTNIPIAEVLYSFGRHIIKVTQQQFPGIMAERGATLKDYLVNLPNYHNRIMLIFPELTPPEFKVSAITDDSLLFHYYTSTPGMKEFMRGYLTELAAVFNNKCTIQHLFTGNDERIEDVFKISF